MSGMTGTGLRAIGETGTLPVERAIGMPVSAGGDKASTCHICDRYRWEFLRR